MKLVKTEATARSKKALPSDFLFLPQLRAQRKSPLATDVGQTTGNDCPAMQEIPDLTTNGFMAPTHSLPTVTPVTCLWAFKDNGKRHRWNLLMSHVDPGLWERSENVYILESDSHSQNFIFYFSSDLKAVSRSHLSLVLLWDLSRSTEFSSLNR